VGELVRRFWTPAAIAAVGLAAFAAIIATPVLASSPPFSQCSAIGKSAGCGILITLNQGSTTGVVQSDPGVGPYDGREDTLVGVVNNTNATITEIALSSTFDIFGLDGDGICASSITPHPSGCPFGPTKYEGPNTSYTIITKFSGIVHFPDGLAPGASTYFGLESKLGSVTVTVPTTQPPLNNPPDCSTATASPNTLWPPNHKFTTITVGGVTDPDGDAVTVTITGVTQDEALTGGGSGNFTPDAANLSKNTVQVRAERAGTGDGRVYRIAFSASDGKGGTCTGTVNVTVPHDQSGAAAVDSGVSFNSFG